MTMKITRLRTARWLPLSPISCYSEKFLKPLNIQKQLSGGKIPNYPRKQSLIFPRRTLLAEKARRNHSGQLVGLVEKVIVLSIKQGRFSTENQTSTHKPEDPAFHDHLTQIRHSHLARPTFRKNEIFLKTRKGMESTIEHLNLLSSLPTFPELFPTVLLVQKTLVCSLETNLKASSASLKLFHWNLSHCLC